MKGYQIAVGFGLFLWSGVSAADVKFNQEIPSCVGLGYDMSLKDCLSQMKSLLGSAEYAKFHPLHCPYDYNQVRCWRSNCGGYNITSPDERFTTEECLAGIEQGKAVKYMRYTGCVGKDGVTYRYDNGDCIERCDLLKYPYDTPPGTLYGKIETCYDDRLHYGYSECNEGFGELKNGSYIPKNGRCDMIICDVNVYPYFEKPDERRGKLEMCAGGTNKYYRYEKASCEANGYIYKNGGCQKRFDITDTDFPEIMYGDLLSYNGTDIGTIIHLPDGKDNRYVATAPLLFMGSWGKENTGLSNVPNVKTLAQASADIKGKCHTKKYYNAIAKDRPFECVRYAYEYYPKVCGKDNPYCGAGQWYVGALGEIEYFWEDNRIYLFRNVISIDWNVFYIWSSTQYSSNIMWIKRDIAGKALGFSFLTHWVRMIPLIEFGPKKTVCD